MTPFFLGIAAFVYAGLAGYGLAPHPWPVVVIVVCVGAAACSYMNAP